MTTAAIVFVRAVSVVAHIAVEISVMRVCMRVAAHFFRPLRKFFIRSVTTQTLGHADLCSRSHFRRPMAAVAVKPCLKLFVRTEYVSSKKHPRCKHAEEQQR